MEVTDRAETVSLAVHESSMSMATATVSYPPGYVIYRPYPVYAPPPIPHPPPVVRRRVVVRQPSARQTLIREVPIIVREKERRTNERPSVRRASTSGYRGRKSRSSDYSDSYDSYDSDDSDDYDHRRGRRKAGGKSGGKSDGEVVLRNNLRLSKRSPPRGKGKGKDTDKDRDKNYADEPLDYAKRSLAPQIWYYHPPGCRCIPCSRGIAPGSREVKQEKEGAYGRARAQSQRGTTTSSYSPKSSFEREKQEAKDLADLITRIGDHFSQDGVFVGTFERLAMSQEGWGRDDHQKRGARKGKVKDAVATGIRVA